MMIDLVAPATREDDVASADISIDSIKREIQERVPLFTAPLPVDELYRLETELTYRQDLLQTATMPSGRSVRGRLKVFFKKMVCRTIRWLLTRQVEFNIATVEYCRESIRWNSLLEQNMTDLAAMVTTLQKQVDGLTQRMEELSAQQQPMQEQVSALQDQLLMLRCRLRRAPSSAEATMASSPGVATDEVLDPIRLAARTRSTRSEMIQRQRVFLDYFREVGKVLVLGCGRGEFLESLSREGLPCLGVESNRNLADFCLELGLPVSHADELPYLAQVIDGTLGGIFTSQIVETMLPEQIARFLAQCWQKLQPGGRVVIEALNPACPDALADFYLDPARLRPVPPKLLGLLCEEQGFQLAEYVWLNPAKGLAPCLKTGDLRHPEVGCYKAYALVIRK